MNIGQMKYDVKNKLLQIKSAAELVSNSDEICMRCQFCGDSKKDHTKKRLYIKINMDNDNMPILYHCFNCGASGILTPSILRTFKINDLNLNSILMGYNKNVITNYNKSIGITDNDLKFIIPKPLNTELNRRKKQYIEDRLGINISSKELIELKTIFSLKQFIEENSLDNKGYRENKLDNKYIGFLTAKNEFINFRDITNTEKLRYDKYSIYKNLDNSRKFYIIPNSIDVLSCKNIEINIAEGIFDILGIYYHIYNKDKDNKIYSAVCGSAYVSVIKYFIQLGLTGNNININIFSDNDKPPSFYKPLKDELSPWVNNINLYYNDKAKDFGVQKKDIYILNKKIR